MDFLEALRLKNIFGGMPPLGNDLPSQGGITGNMPIPPPQMSLPTPTFGPAQSPVTRPNFATGVPPTPTAPTPPNVGPELIKSDFDPNRIPEMMQKLYTPESAASDRYNQMLAQYPQYEKPGKLRNIGSAILGALTDLGTNFGGNRAGVKGIDVFNEASGRAQYGRDIEDWKNRIGPMQKAAELERATNVNERTMAYQTVAQQLRAEADAHNRAEDRFNAGLALRKANLMDFKARFPNTEFDFSQSTVRVKNPTTGEWMDSGYPSKEMSKAEQMMLQLQNQVELAGVRGREARATNEAKPRSGAAVYWPDPNDPTKTLPGVMDLETGVITPGTLDGKPISNVNKMGTKSGVAGQPDPIKLEAIREGAQATLDLINTHLMDDKGNLSDTARRATGWTSYGNFIPTSKGRAGQNVINQIKGQQILNVIGQLKAQSRTGATGFGQMSIKELAVLENAATRLDVAQSEEDFKVALTEIKNKLQKIMLDPIPGSGVAAKPTGQTGKRVVIYKNGQPVGTIPEEQIEDAKKQGFEVR